MIYLKRMLRKMIGMIQIPRNYIWCRLHNIAPDSTWRFYGLPRIKVSGRGASISIGKHFTAVSCVTHNAIGVMQPVILKVLDDNAQIKIGDDVGVSGCSIVACKSITIGNHVLIGSGVVIMDNDLHPINPYERRRGGPGKSGSIIIEDDVFIGARAVILKGVTLGKGCVIGAGAVVGNDIPPFAVAVGNPARIVGDSRK